MPKKMDMMMHDNECCMMHKTWKAMEMLIFGLLVLGNAYWAVVDWFSFIGIMIVLKGLIKLLKPMYKQM